MGARLLRLLLRVTPRGFREEYGDEMCRVADEQWRARRGLTGPIGAIAFWGRQALAVVAMSARLRRHEYGTTGRTTMSGFAEDLGYAVRGLARRPGFTLVTVLTLGLGIGAATAIFSAVDTVLLRPLPYADADRVVVLFQGDVDTGERGEGVSAANLRDVAASVGTLSSVGVAEPWSLDLTVDGRVESLRTWSVSEGFFDAIGATPLLGRTFTESDYVEGGSAVVVLGHRAWSARFGSDPAVVGTDVLLDGQSRTVVGVLPPEFRFPDAAETYIPRPQQPWDESSRPADFMTGVGRLADGTSLAVAEQELDRIAATLRETHPQVNADLDFHAVPLEEHLFGDVRTPLYVMMAAVVVLLLIACANVAGLMLARGAQRERDFALRGALGAGTARLVRHVSAESLVLAFAGSVLGVVLTYGGIAVIRGLAADHLPRIDELSVNGTVLAFALATGALSAVLSGLAPSLRLSKPDLRDALGDGSRGSTGSRTQARARGRLVVSQVAAAVVLLVGAGLLARSFDALLQQDLGFDPEGRLALQIFAYGYESPAEAQVVVDGIVESMEALPGVERVAITTDLPGANDGSIAKIDIVVPFTVDGRAAPPVGQEPQAYVMQVYRDYFGTMGIDVVGGREFAATDNADAAPVVVVNETLARRHFGDADPLGQHLSVRFGGIVPRQIVGVVRDTRPLGHASEPRPEIYFPLAQVPTGSLTFVLETAGDPAALTLPAMEAVWEVAPAQSVWGVAPVETLLAEWLVERRFSLFLLGAFSSIALLLAAIGLYGLLTFSVERRQGELGIRRALGGHSADLIRMVLSEGARLAATGVVIGLAASWYLSRFISGMLFEVSPTDPLTFASLAVLIMTIAGVATLLPAVRALRVDPAEALRQE